MNPEQEHDAVVENYRTAADLVGTLALLGPLERDRKHAIHAGLFLRLRSLMQSVLCLTEGIGHGEAMLALTRLVMETTITIRYLVMHGNQEMYDRFVSCGLRDEVAVLDDIQRRIDERGTGEMPIERRMTMGIERQILDSDVTVAAARSSRGSWGTNYQDRMKAIGGGRAAYLYFQRIPSAAVHGDWSNLLRFHLAKRSGGYSPAYNRSGEEQKLLLNPSAGMVSEAAIAYARTYRPGARSLIRSLEDCIDAVRSAEYRSGDFEI